MRERGEIDRGTGGLARCRPVLVAWVAGSALLLGMTGAGCATPVPDAPAGVGSPGSPGKISPRLGAQSSLEGGVLAVLIRTERPLNERQRRQLRAAGVEVDAVSGDIVSGRVAKRYLERLSALPFVRYIEPASPLGPAREERR